jgi:multiple sugar transport system ATP-binding protein
VSALKLTGIRKSFGGTEVLRGIDLEVEPGRFVVFVGPSGCGKSTLLRVIAGLEEQSAGHVEIAGRVVDRVPPARRGIAMVFQTYALYPHLTAAGNMGLALKEDGVAKAEREARVARAAAMLDLGALLERRPAELSGGQRQRVAIGRAIVRDPKLFLFDEPLSNLDAALRVNTRLEIARLHKELSAAMIYVTHDQVEAMTLADTIVVLNKGVVEQAGRPIDLYNRPDNMFVAGFIGSPRMNFLGGEEAAREGAATLGVRPEHLAPDGEGRWAGTVRHAEHLGSDTFLYLTLDGGGTLTMRSPGQSAIAVGESVRLSPLPGTLHRFGADGRALR